MFDIKLNSESDLVFSNQDVQLVEGVPEVEQAVHTELATREGEFFGDEQMGLDQEYLLGKSFNEQYGAAAITECVQKDCRVSSMQSVTLNGKAHRQLQVAVQFGLKDNLNGTTEVMVGA